jgi:hypothetical protein
MNLKGARAATHSAVSLLAGLGLSPWVIPLLYEHTLERAASSPHTCATVWRRVSLCSCMFRDAGELAFCAYMTEGTGVLAHTYSPLYLLLALDICAAARVRLILYLTSR